MKKSKPINPSNPYETKTKSNPRTDLPVHHHQLTHPPPLSSNQPIKPTADQPIHHHRVPKSNPLPINPSNPSPINPSTTTEFPNQETKTLVLHKTKLHGRKREEALPRAHRRERERCLLGME